MTDSLLIEALSKLAPNTILAIGVSLFLRAVTPKITDFLAHLTKTLAEHGERLTGIETKLDTVKADVASAKTDVASANAKLDQLLARRDERDDAPTTSRATSRRQLPSAPTLGVSR
jgi:outer membrane murein-binding lipoprotein Lpp